MPIWAPGVATVGKITTKPGYVLADENTRFELLIDRIGAWKASVGDIFLIGGVVVFVALAFFRRERLPPMFEELILRLKKWVMAIKKTF